ncbi:uncharacterized protein LOC114762398 [Neltuma alba]|uniref:uncharacterized protein LOC114762398 n=1 Tax=Neltuma alba TaxID=207710 RepID=UPI0010A48B23|nr:uncharacterized protein LOC114762398 [Prosopis alba]
MEKVAAEDSGPWMIIGDLNDIKGEDEKRGGAPINQAKCSKFVERIDKCGLMEIQSYGNNFTWKGPLIPGFDRIFEKLDRGLCSIEWRQLFQEAGIKVLPRLGCSDHNPLLLYLKEERRSRGERPFRFEAAWMMHSNFTPMLRENWRKGGEAISNLVELKGKLTEWNRNTFLNILKKKK